jgi:LysM repeat protein
MAKRYMIRSGDTLGKIARRFYGDPSLFRKLALYNGIHNPNRITVGQTIEVPSRRELDGKPASKPAPQVAVPAVVSDLATPNGLEELIATFGDIRAHIRDDGTLKSSWEKNFLTRTRLPFSMPLSWEPKSRVLRLYCHKKLKNIFPAVFAEIQKQGLKKEIRAFGGCYNYRPKRTSGKLSTHCWGIGIDLNPETNAQGTTGDMHPGVVAIFRQFGFKWGGDWTGKSKDPMHFQYCTGY